MVRVFSFLGVWISLLGLSALAAKPIPNAPKNYVFDEPSLLSEPAKSILFNVLTEHEHATGDQIVVAIFKSLDGEDLVDFSSRVFSAWKPGKSKIDNGALIALYLQERKVRIEVGYGLEPVLTDLRTKEVIEEQIIPNLKAKNPDGAIVGGVVEVLRVLESPLVQSGKLDQLLSGSPIADRLFRSPRTNSGSLPALLFLFFFLVWLIRLIDRFRGAHYSQSGWYHSRPRIRVGGLGGWGGGSGGGLGGFGGGFGGGGGRSGGGGASGSW